MLLSISSHSRLVAASEQAVSEIDATLDHSSVIYNGQMEATKSLIAYYSILRKRPWVTHLNQGGGGGGGGVMKSLIDKRGWCRASTLCTIRATCTHAHCHCQAAAIVVMPFFCGHRPTSAFFAPLVGKFDDP